jgi:hypothetical protein
MDARPAGQAERITESLERYGEFLRDVKKEQEKKGVGSVLTDDMLDHFVDRVLGTEAEAKDEGKAVAKANGAS